MVKYILESHQIFQKDAGEMAYINMLQIHTLLKLYKSMGERILHEGLSHDEACTYEKELIAFYKKVVYVII